MVSIDFFQQGLFTPNVWTVVYILISVASVSKYLLESLLYVFITLLPL